MCRRPAEQRRVTGAVTPNLPAAPSCACTTGRYSPMHCGHTSCGVGRAGGQRLSANHNLHKWHD